MAEVTGFEGMLTDEDFVVDDEYVAEAVAYKKAERQAELEKMKAEFFARGGTITVVPSAEVPFANYAGGKGAKP